MFLWLFTLPFSGNFPYISLALISWQYLYLSPSPFCHFTLVSLISALSLHSLPFLFSSPSILSFSTFHYLSLTPHLYLYFYPSLLFPLTIFIFFSFISIPFSSLSLSLCTHYLQSLFPFSLSMSQTAQSHRVLIPGRTRLMWNKPQLEYSFLQFLNLYTLGKHIHYKLTECIHFYCKYICVGSIVFQQIF